MAAPVKICSYLRKIAKTGSCFQGFAAQISTPTRARFLSSSGAVYSGSNGIESNPFYEKYAERIKEVRNDIKEGRLEEKTVEEKFCLDGRAQGEAERFKHKVQQKAADKLLLGNKPLSSRGETSIYGEKTQDIDNAEITCEPLFFRWKGQPANDWNVFIDTKGAFYLSELAGQIGQIVNGISTFCMTLNSVMHLDKVADKSAEEIGQIWREHHKNKDCISAVIPSNLYDRIEERSLKFPLFIYPLHREQGYEFMYAEFKDHKCYFTSLLHYQTRGENAPWSLAMKHFTDLRESKGIVLMVGEVDTNEMSVLDAQWLAYQVQMYYASDSDHREEILKTFNRFPDKFDHMTVVHELNAEIESRIMTGSYKDLE